MTTFLFISLIIIWTGWFLWAFVIGADMEQCKPYVVQKRARMALYGVYGCLGYTVAVCGYFLYLLITGG